MGVLQRLRVVLDCLDVLQQPRRQRACARRRIPLAPCTTCMHLLRSGKLPFLPWRLLKQLSRIFNIYAANQVTSWFLHVA